MSRSKRAPIHTDGYGSKRKKEAKRNASRVVRHADEVASGGAYKKQSCAWDICDWKFYDPRNPKAGRK